MCRSIGFSNFDISHIYEYNTGGSAAVVIYVACTHVKLKVEVMINGFLRWGLAPRGREAILMECEIPGHRRGVSSGVITL